MPIDMQSPPAAQVPAPIHKWLQYTTAFLSIAVALVSYRYFFSSIPTPPAIQANHFRDPWLLVHVASAATALLIGPAQFFPNLRARFKLMHRLMGRLYVAGCLIGGVSGLALAVGVTNGRATALGFGTLAVLWFAATLLAWRHAVQRRLEDHKSWMIRSFALTLAAVTLRIYLPIGGMLPVSFESAYGAISFLCWVPNLLIAEIYLRRRSNA